MVAYKSLREKIQQGFCTKRARERQRQRQRDRQTNRKTQADRQTDRQTDKALGSSCKYEKMYP